MKKTVSILLAVLFVLTQCLCLFSGAFAETWSYTLKDGVLSIYGTGEVGSLSSGSGDYPWNSNRGSITEVTVGNGITLIGKCAFTECPSLKKVTYGRDVTTIGMDAMAYCSSLKEIVFGGPITKIGQGSVYSSGGLSLVTLSGQTRADFLAVASQTSYNDNYSKATFVIGSGEEPADPYTFDIEPLYDIIENYPLNNGKITDATKTCFIVGGPDSKSIIMAGRGFYTLSVEVFDETAGVGYTIDRYFFDTPDDEIYGEGEFLRLMLSDYGVDLLADHAYTLSLAFYDGGRLVCSGKSEDGAFLSTNDSFLEYGQVVPEVIPHESKVEGGVGFADMNADGIVNIADVTTVLDALSGIDGALSEYADVDLSFDRNFTIADVTALLDILSGVETLKYALDTSGKSYTVVGSGNVSEKKITVPENLNGIPVTAIGPKAFSDIPKLSSVKISANVKKIAAGALISLENLKKVSYGGSAEDWAASGARTAKTCVVGVASMPEITPDVMDSFDLKSAAKIGDLSGYGGGLRVKSSGELLFSPTLTELRNIVSQGRNYNEFTAYLRFTLSESGVTFPSFSVKPVKSKGSFVDFFLVGADGSCGFCPTAGKNYTIETVIFDDVSGKAILYGTYDMTADAGYAGSAYYDPTPATSSGLIPANVRLDGLLFLEYSATKGGRISGKTSQTVAEKTNAATVEAIPDSGYSFLCWSDGSMEAKRTETMPDDEDLSFTAYFAVKAEDTGVANMFIFTETGTPVLKKDYVGAFVAVTNSDGYDIGATAKMKGRGNSSWNGGAAQTDYDSKNSYRLKFDEKLKLLGLGNKKYKDWVLQANKFDLSGLRNALVWALADKMGTIPYVSDNAWVQLYVNNEYRGLYMVCEQMEAKEGRASVDDSIEGVDKGYFIEADFRGDGDTDPYFRINGYKDSTEFVIKSDIEGDDDIRFIQNYVQNCHNAIMSGSRSAMEELLDVDSLIDMYIIEELSKDCDVGNASFYMQKDAGGKLFFTAPWDFDFGFGTYGDGISTKGLVSKDDGGCTWFASLITREWFRTAVADRMSELADEFEEVMSFILEKKVSMKAAVDKNANFWRMYGRNYHGYVSSQVSSALHTYEEHVDFLVNWTRTRWSTLYELITTYGR